MASASKTRGCHNSPAAFRAKIEMREAALEWVGPKAAHVFDAYCGPVGEMHAAVWHRAASYLGCDLVWHPEDPRRRVVSDTQRALRAFDLAAFNVFDIDAFGSPWEAAIIVAKRRTWKPGERGALIVTDGSAGFTRYGRLSLPLSVLTGIARDAATAATPHAHEGLFPIALRRWAAMARVEPVRMLRAKGNGSGKGGTLMLYGALLFTGAQPQAKAA